MRARHLFPLVGFLLAGLTPGPQPIGAQEYVVLGTPLVNLRTGPSTNAMVVGRAEKGDIFELLGEENGWYKIRMFSPEPRYVVKADFVYPLTGETLVEGYQMFLPTSTAKARSVFWDTESGLDRAAREATEILPVTMNRERHAYLKHVLEDRVLLEMFHIHGIQPALYQDLVAEARKLRW